jgi:protocatechuate 3,4-dioxygenase beta subunit
MAPNTPLTVEFNQPVDIDSAQIPLLSYPWLAGDMEWDDSRTRLTFTPETGLFPSERYTLFVNDKLKSDSGGTLDTAPSWDIQMLPRPHVIQHQPGEVHLSSRLPTIQLEFSEQMEPESIISSLSVQPETPLSLTFEGNTAWITPQQPLLPGTRYHFTLTGSAKDIRGAVIGQDYRWDYSLPGLVLNVTDTGLTEPNDRLAVNFNYPLQQTELSNLLSTRPAVDGGWSWRGKQQIVLQTAQPLDYSTEYTIEFLGELIDANQDPFPPPPPLTYNSPPPILGTFPNWAVLGDINDPVVITFTLPMDQASVEAAFRLEPAVDGSFSWNGNAMYFKPEGGLQPNTRYTALLDTSALTLAGQAALLEPYTWSFEPIASYFYGVTTFGDYGPNAQVLDVDGRRAVQFYAPEDSGVLDFELYRLSLAQFLDRYASGFRGVAGFQRAPISTEGASFITTWSETIRGKDGGYDGTSRETIVPEQVEAGLYLLNMSGEDDTFSQLILVLTRNTVMVKQAEGQIVSWVTDINGDPRPGVRVSIFARDGELISQGRADEHGVFSTGIDKDPQPLIVVAEDSLELTGREIEGTDITVSGLSDEWQTGGGWYGWWRPIPVTHKYAAYIYTDRPIYKPGQDVFFKVVLRSDSDAQIDLLPESTPATVRMRDVRNNIVQSLELVTNEYGTLHGQFSLAVGAMLGDYQLEVSVDGEEFRQLFKVQDYRKPDYEITVSTDKLKYVAGDPIQVGVDASYFFGQPLSNASVTIKLYELVQSEMYGWIDDEKDIPEYIWIGGYDPSIRGTTDENGYFSDGSLVASLGSMGVPAPYEQNGVQSITWGIEATVDDGSHQTVSSFSVVEVYSAEESISLDVGNWLKTPGEPFELSGNITDLEGLPVSGRNLRLELLQYNPDKYNYDRLVDSMALTSDGAGKVQIDYTIDRSGYYKMSLTGQDERGNEIGANAWLYAYSSQESWANQYIETLRIASDKGTYQPGDTARLVIESSFSGPALLAFERGLTRRILPVRLESPATLIEVPIQADDAPNIFVTVNAWQAQDTSLTEFTYTNLNDSRLQTASTEISVPVAGKTLSVAITPDRQSYTPNDQATFTIQVSDEQGNPVQAELSAALVDEAIFSLSEELSGPIFEAFYAPRRHIVRTYDSMSLTRILMSGGMGGGGGGEGAANPRTDFPDTAAWFPVFYTDEQGKVTFPVNLPDTLTSWRMTVKAVTTDSKVGQAHTNITVSYTHLTLPTTPYV